MGRPLFHSLFDETERKPLTVSELTSQIRSTVERRFGSVWVEGEISNYKAHSSGHWYFTIKDEGAQLRAKCFRSANCRIKFRLVNGLKVQARGRIGVYPPKGEYELIVEALDPAGAGALQLAFQQTRDRLAAEGLFEEKLKRPLPIFPRRVGVVTSRSGAAIRDIIQIVSRRTRTVNILVMPVKVQGPGAASAIAHGIKALNRYHKRAVEESRTADKIDVLIVGRGGGSIEDLWAFNEEQVARAIRQSAIPVISAVGHETDFTIADFAADLRVSTPSAAAELVAAREDELERHVAGMVNSLQHSIRFRLMRERDRLSTASASPALSGVLYKLRGIGEETAEFAHRLQILSGRRLVMSRRMLDELAVRLSPERLRTTLFESISRLNSAFATGEAAVNSKLEGARRRLGVASARLETLSPLSVLDRGYALVRNQQGNILMDAKAASVGEPLSVRLARGQLGCRVETVEES